MDKIIIKGLELRINIGLPEKERSKKQKVILDCEISHSLIKAGRSDRIKDTINYSKVSTRITEISNQKFLTLESLAYQVATAIKSEFKAKQVKILAKKPGALKRFKAEYAAVEVTR